MGKLKLTPYKVRVRKFVEDWVDVEAASADAAEKAALQIPGVISVMQGMAVLATKPQGQRLATVEDEEDA